MTGSGEEMSRNGAAFFLGDSAFLADTKFRALARILTDPDEFNSAVGAYWIALAAARRQRSAQIDVHEETGSSYCGPLIEVGLITDDGFPDGAFSEWAPSTPQQIAGRARAEQAERGEKGRFLPASTSSTSESSALASLEELDQPSLLLPSSLSTLASNSLTPRAPARERDPGTESVIEDLHHAEYESSKLADRPFAELLPKP